MKSCLEGAFSSRACTLCRGNCTVHAFTASGNPSVPGATPQPHSAWVRDFSLEPKWHTPRSGPALCLYLHLKENISAKWHKKLCLFRDSHCCWNHATDSSNIKGAGSELRSWAYNGGYFCFCGGKLVIGNYSFITQVSAGYLGEREGRFPDSCPLVSEGQSQGNDKSQSEWVDCIKNAQYILDYRGKNGGGCRQHVMA